MNYIIVIFEQGEARYIVDYHMLKRMHPNNSIFQQNGDDLGEEAMNAKSPPDDDFLALLPSHIHAFSLHRKHWRKNSAPLFNSPIELLLMDLTSETSC